MAAVALLTVTALGSLLINRANQRQPDLSTPDGVVTAYIQAIQAGDADTAWNLLAPERVQQPPLKTGNTKEQFQSQVQSNRRQSSSRIRISSVTTSGDTATVVVEITQTSGDLFSGAYSHFETVTLRREGASWLITSDAYPWLFQ